MKRAGTRIRKATHAESGSESTKKAGIGLLGRRRASEPYLTNRFS
jgi:hypothetical protein